MRDTILIFTSDNGGLSNIATSSETIAGHVSNGPLRGHKADIFEGGHRVPMIIKWKGHIDKGQSRSHMVGLNDLYATLCDLVGIEVPVGQAQDSVTSFADYIYDGNNTDGLWGILRNLEVSGRKRPLIPSTAKE